MANTFDLVVRKGNVFDGRGAEPRVADVAVRNGRIVEVGRVHRRGREEIDARGFAVTPGFVDIHTHYDGQVTWDNRLAPSSSHGVTTVVMGNCGVGFAPCRADQHDMLVRLMEGVEDIPHPVLVDGVPWRWESFPEYLDFLATRRYDMDICGYLPHSALRVFVMGQRGVEREAATPADIARMCDMLRQAMAAGAMGFSTSSTFFHRSSDGLPTPTYRVAEAELTALAGVLKACGRGVIELIIDFDDAEGSFACLRRMVAASGRPLSFTLLEGDDGPQSHRWREILEWIAAANASGLPIKGQVLGRALGLLFGHELTLNPFYSTTAYRELAHLPLRERLLELRRPQVRDRILAEPADPNPLNVLGRMVRDFDRIFLLGDPPDYEPTPDRSIAALARRRGISSEALAYELMLERDGRNLLYYAHANYAKGSLDTCLEMMTHPGTVLGLGDGGAHCGTICDGSFPTFMLTHWGRDRSRGERLPLPWIVKALTLDPAAAVGLMDRGVVAPGYKADLNIFDPAALRLSHPEVVYDLPSGGRRLVQSAQGYLATIVSGTVVYREGLATGSLPGRLVRGAQCEPIHARERTAA